SEALDRPFSSEGDLSVNWRRDAESNTWLPWPHIAAEQMMLGNPDWAEGDTFVTLERVEMRLALLPLLGKVARIPRIDVTQPVAGLQRLEDGRNNWTLDRKSTRLNSSHVKISYAVFCLK